MVTPDVDSLLTSAHGGATKRFLTPADLAAELSVSLRTAYRLAEEIGATRIGKLVRVSREAFEAWLAQQNPSSNVPAAPSTTHGFPTRARGAASASRRGAEPRATPSPGVDATSRRIRIRPVKRRGLSRCATS
jgi:excisionase family DNA binding protein